MARIGFKKNVYLQKDNLVYKIVDYNCYTELDSDCGNLELVCGIVNGEYKLAKFFEKDLQKDRFYIDVKNETFEIAIKKYGFTLLDKNPLLIVNRSNKKRKSK